MSADLASVEGRKKAATFTNMKETGFKAELYETHADNDDVAQSAFIPCIPMRNPVVLNEEKNLSVVIGDVKSELNLFKPRAKY